jgi:hypothetical protein
MTEFKLIICPQCKFSNFSVDQIEEKISCPRCRTTFIRTEAQTIPQKSISSGFTDSRSRERFWTDTIFGFRDPKDSRIYPTNGILNRYMSMRDGYEKIRIENALFITPQDDHPEESLLSSCEKISIECEEISKQMYQYLKYPPHEFDMVDANVVLYDAKAKSCLLLALENTNRANIIERPDEAREYYRTAKKYFFNAAQAYRLLIENIQKIGETKGHILSAEIHNLQIYADCCDLSADLSEAVMIYPEDKKTAMDILGKISEKTDNIKEGEFSYLHTKAEHLLKSEEDHTNEVNVAESSIKKLRPSFISKLNEKVQNFKKTSDRLRGRINTLTGEYHKKEEEFTNESNHELEQLKQKNLYINLTIMTVSIIIAFAWIWFLLIPYWWILLIVGIICAVIIGVLTGGNPFFAIIAFIAVLFGTIALGIYIISWTYKSTKKKTEEKRRLIQTETIRLNKEKNIIISQLENEIKNKLSITRGELTDLSRNTKEIASGELANLRFHVLKLQALYLWKYNANQFIALNDIEQEVSEINNIDPVKDLPEEANR